MQRDAGDSGARCAYADALIERGERAEAIDVLRRAASTPSADARTLLALGYALAFDFANVITPSVHAAEADACLRRAVALAPDCLDARIALSDLTEHAMGDRAGAEALLLEALPRWSGAHAIHERLARLSILRHGKAGAESRLRRWWPEPPPAEMHLALASAYARCGCYDEVQREYDRLAAIRPTAVETLVGLGYTAAIRGEPERAHGYFARAHHLHPADAGVLFHYLQHLVRVGRYDEAQRLFRARWSFRRRNGHEHGGDDAPIDWTGDDLRGRTILIPAWRGGFGDGLQFNQFASYLKERGATVIAEGRRQILPLLRTIRGVDLAVQPFDDRPAVDVQCRSYFISLLVDWTWESWRARQPGLTPDPELMRRFRPRVPDDGRLNVGICWQCGHVDSRDDPYTYRAAPLGVLRPLAERPDVRLFSLQVDSRDEIRALFGDGVVHADDEMVRGFAATAALIACLDIIVTVDTAIAHVAGGLGASGFLLLPYFADCRWLSDPAHCWFYPSLRVIRQSSPGDWTTSVAQVTRLLDDLSPRPSPTSSRRTLAQDRRS